MMSDDYSRYSKVKKSMQNLEKIIEKYLAHPGRMAPGFYEEKLVLFSHSWQYSDRMKKESSTIYKSSRQEYSEILRQKQEILKEMKLEEERIYREDIDLNFLFSEPSLQETSGVDPDTILQVVDSLTRLVA